jgi:hypothetical protein
MTAAPREPLDAVAQMRRDIDRTVMLFTALAFGVGLAVGWSVEPMRRCVRWQGVQSTAPTLEQNTARPRVCIAVAAPRGRLCVEWIRATAE